MVTDDGRSLPGCWRQVGSGPPIEGSNPFDRSHRIGQTQHVFAYRLICRDTVEEKIIELQQKKRDLADAILNADNKGVIQNLTRDDLEFLLS